MKGPATYYRVDVDAEINFNAAWFYPNPSAAAQHIKD